jgi:hypothetical protein
MWVGDEFGVGSRLRGKRRERDAWGMGQGEWFVDESEGVRMGIQSEVLVLEDGERVESLVNGSILPWEGERTVRF